MPRNITPYIYKKGKYIDIPCRECGEPTPRSERAMKTLLKRGIKPICIMCKMKRHREQTKKNYLIRKGVDKQSDNS